MEMKISDREKAFILIGLLLGMIPSGFMFFTRQKYSPPTGHSVSYIRNDVLYNELKNDYVPEMNISMGMILSMDIEMDDSVYKNAGFKVILLERISVDAVVFLDLDKESLKIIKNIEIDEVYTIDFDTNNFSGLLVFLDTETDDFVIQYNLWLW